MTVRYRSATLNEFIEHHSYDVSRGGMFIKTPSPFAPGTLLKFEVRISSDQRVLQGVGRVVWKREDAGSTPDAPAGMGIKFIKIDDASRGVIEKLVESRGHETQSAFDRSPDSTSAPMFPPSGSIDPSEEKTVVAERSELGLTNAPDSTPDSRSANARNIAPPEDGDRKTPVSSTQLAETERAVASTKVSSGQARRLELVQEPSEESTSASSRYPNDAPLPKDAPAEPESTGSKRLWLLLGVVLLGIGIYWFAEQRSPTRIAPEAPAVPPPESPTSSVQPVDETPAPPQPEEAIHPNNDDRTDAAPEEPEALPAPAESTSTAHPAESSTPHDEKPKAPSAPAPRTKKPAATPKPEPHSPAPTNDTTTDAPTTQGPAPELKEPESPPPSPVEPQKSESPSEAP